MFRNIWENFGWGTSDRYVMIGLLLHQYSFMHVRSSRSGPGSTPEGSAMARHAIESVIKKYNITTLLDAPCGSFRWMPLIDFEALGVTYVGTFALSQIKW